MSSAVRVQEYCARQADKGVHLDVRVHPGSKHEGLALAPGVLHIRTSAPPRDGEANEAVVRVIAKLLAVPKSAVAVVRGHKDRSKTLLVGGVSAERVAAVLGGLERAEE
jgi:uncharacterized protein (TIGR00251 family)